MRLKFLLNFLISIKNSKKLAQKNFRRTNFYKKYIEGRKFIGRISTFKAVSTNELNTHLLEYKNIVMLLYSKMNGIFIGIVAQVYCRETNILFFILYWEVELQDSRREYLFVSCFVDQYTNIDFIFSRNITEKCCIIWTQIPNMELRKMSI